MNERTKIVAKTPNSKKEKSVSQANKTELYQYTNSPIDHILYLQRTIGNQAVGKLFKSGIIQAKLKIGQPGDKYEQEADRVADAVMRMPEPKAQRQAEKEEELEEEEIIQQKPLYEQITPLVQRQEEEEEEQIQTKSIAEQVTPLVQRQGDEEEEEETLQPKQDCGQTAEATPKLESRIQSLGSGGQPLPKSTRAFFEPRFGYDLRRVRVHNDSRAVELAQGLNSRAFTIGQNVVFGAGQYAPETSKGRRLLAHELTHVLQQNGRNNGSGIDLQRSPDREVWGGFRIVGEPDFITKVREDLEKLNSIPMGSELLKLIEENRSPWYKNRIRIESYKKCGFLGGYVLYNTSSCAPDNRCRKGDSTWPSVDNYVYLFHEIVHAYLYYIAGKGSHSENECMATGLGHYFTSIPYNENKLRCYLGLPVRPCYDSECTSLSPPTCPKKT